MRSQILQITYLPNIMYIDLQRLRNSLPGRKLLANLTRLPTLKHRIARLRNRTRMITLKPTLRILRQRNQHTLPQSHTLTPQSNITPRQKESLQLSFLQQSQRHPIRVQAVPAQSFKLGTISKGLFHNLLIERQLSTAMIIRRRKPANDLSGRAYREHRILKVMLLAWKRIVCSLFAFRILLCFLFFFTLLRSFALIIDLHCAWVTCSVDAERFLL